MIRLDCIKTDSKYHPDKQLISEGKLSYFTKKGPKIKYRQQLSQVFNRNMCIC